MTDRSSWTYNTIEWEPDDTWSGVGGSRGMEEMLRTQGAEGWELVAVVRTDSGLLHYFKQPA